MLSIKITIELEKIEKKWKINIPTVIKNASKSEHNKQIIKILFFFNPCSITKIFCAPMAKIKLNPVIKPNINISIF